MEKKYLFYNGVEVRHYQVDTDGNVYVSNTGQKLTTFTSWNGYDRVKLSVGVKRGMYLVHRLVASTFIENPDNLPIVNHKNNIRNDNRVENLEWCNNSKNQKQRFKTHKGTKRKPVKMIDLKTGEVLKIFESPQDAETETGIARQNISKVALGHRNHAGGYRWEY